MLDEGPNIRFYGIFEAELLLLSLPVVNLLGSLHVPHERPLVATLHSLWYLFLNIYPFVQAQRERV